MADPAENPAMPASHGVGSTESEFWCFISYRHADNAEKGREWASWLHRELETYEVPKELVGAPNLWGRPVPARIFPVFRDEEELPAYADLSAAIVHALRRSLSLVVICSPSACQSKFVNEEVLRFKAMGRSSRASGLVIRGVPDGASADNCVPYPLSHRVSADGFILPESDSPLLFDMRDEAGREEWIQAAPRIEALRQGGLGPREAAEVSARRERRLQDAKLALVAWVLGVPEDVLRRAHERRLRALRRGKVITWVSWAAVASLAAAASVVGYRLARDMQRSASASGENARLAARSAEEVARESSRNAEEARVMGLRSLHKDGLGFLRAQKYREAAEAFRRAADGGHVEGCFELGKLLLGDKAGPPDLAAATRYLSLAADGGHAGAMSLLGKALLSQGEAEKTRGIGLLREALRLGDDSAALDLAKALLARSPAEARQLVTRLAEAGDVEACWILAGLLRAERPGPAAGTDVPGWYVWMTRSADKGWVPAMRDAGIAFWRDGNLGPLDRRSSASMWAALRHLLAASSRGDAAAAAFLRELYAARANFPAADAEALEFALEGARSGVPEAMLMSATLLASSSAAPDDAPGREAELWLARVRQGGDARLRAQSDRISAAWYLRLARAASGSPRKDYAARASLRYAEVARQGSDPAVLLEAAQAAQLCDETDAAVRWLEAAEATGSDEARRQLAALLLNVRKDANGARRLLEKGAELGDGAAALMLADWMIGHARTPDQLAATLKVYLRGAEVGNGPCAMRAAAMLRAGHGCPVDLPRAEKLERQALATGDPACLLERARSLLKASPARPSLVEAHACLRLAAAGGLSQDCAPLLARVEPALTAEERRDSERLQLAMARPTPSSPRLPAAAPAR